MFCYIYIYIKLCSLIKNVKKFKSNHVEMVTKIIYLKIKIPNINIQFKYIYYLYFSL